MIFLFFVNNKVAQPCRNANILNKEKFFSRVILSKSACQSVQEHDIDLFLHLWGMNVKDFALGVQQLSALHTSNPHIAF